MTVADDLRSDIIVYYPLANANDYGPNSLNGTVIGDALFTGGIAGGCMDCRAGRLYCGDHISLHFDQYLSLSIWVKLGDADVYDAPAENASIVTKFRDFGNSDWSLSITEVATVAYTGIEDHGVFQANIHFYAYDGINQISAKTTSLPLRSDVWTHVVMVMDLTQASNSLKYKIFVNKVAETLTFSGTSITGIRASNAQLVIGGGDPDGFIVNNAWWGCLDEFGLWDRPLTTDEINYLGNLDSDIESNSLYETWTKPISTVRVYGDSIAAGGPLNAHQCYPFPPSTEFATINRSLGGSDIANAHARWAADIADGAYSYGLLIHSGVNDLAGIHINSSGTTVTKTALNDTDTWALLEAFIDAALLVHPKVYVATIAPWKNSSYWNSDKQIYTDNINAWISAKAGIIVLPVFDLLTDGADALQSSYDSGDHIHISQEAADVVRTSLYGYIAANPPRQVPRRRMRIGIKIGL